MSLPSAFHSAVADGARSDSFSIFPSSGASAPDETKSGAEPSRIQARSGALPPAIWVVSVVV
jgi:hypothetical protein